MIDEKENIKCPRPTQSDLVLSLCPKCRHEFFQIPENVIRRANPFQVEKERCNVCQTAFGFDYSVSKRKVHRQ